MERPSIPPVAPRKQRIFYSRAYRTFPPLAALHIVLCLLIFGLVFVSVIVYRVELTRIVAVTASHLARLAGVDAGVTRLDFLWGHVYTVDALGSFPSLNYAFLSFVVCILVVLVVPRLKKLSPPIAFWFMYVFIIHLISSVFFIFFPEYFPYTLLDFTSLYMMVEVIMWILIPLLVLGISWYCPAGIVAKTTLLLATVIYSFVFGMVRLALFVIVLEHYSVIFMAVMFFMFGALVDFIYLTGFYSLFAVRTANGLAKRRDVWRWSS